MSAPRSHIPIRAHLFAVLSAFGALGGAVHGAAAQGTPVKLQTITPREGLSSGVVTAIYRDRPGFLWVGTPNGLNRYDGHSVLVSKFDRTEPGTLPNNHVRALAEDAAGRLWIGTAGGGLSWLDRSTGRFQDVAEDRYNAGEGRQEWVESIVPDGTGGLWIGTLGGGVSHYWPADGTTRTYDMDPGNPGSLSHSMVNVVFVDSGGDVWVGTDRGLNLWLPESDTFRRWLADPSDDATLSSDRVLAVTEDSTGVLWVGTEEGLNRFSPEDSTFVRIPHDGRPGGLSHPHVTALAPGHAGTLWVGTYGGGLDELDTETDRVVAVHRAGDWTSGLVDDRIRRITAEPDGTLWLGTWGGGVSRLIPLPVEFALVRNDSSDPSSLSTGEVTSMATDRRNDLWFATFFNGLNRRRPDGAGFDHYRHDPNDPQSLSGDDTYRLLASTSGRLWVGTWQNGLNRFDPETGLADRYPSDPDRPGALSGNRVTALAEDGAGTLWVGTNNGLNRLDVVTPPGRFYLVPGLEDTYVEALLEDEAGILWVGTAGSGLFRLDPETLQVSRYMSDPERPDALSHDHVTTIHQDPEGGIWVGTLGGGVCHLRGDPGSTGEASCVQYGEASGLIDNSVTTILSDDRGRLWISTKAGLSILDRETGRFTGFDTDNGLPVDEFSAGSGVLFGERVWLGTPEGILSAPRWTELPEARPAPLVITDARALETHESLLTHATGGKASLPYGEVVVFEFALLDYDVQAEERHAYRLDGLNTDWVDVGETREIAFTNLAPGDYAFWVRARSRNGPWSQVEDPVRFAIVPPVWMTAPFRALLALVVGIGLLLAYRLRTSSIRERRKAVEEKERQFTALMENSHDLVALLGPQHEIVFVGPSVQRILGYGVAERTGASLPDLAHPEDRDELKHWLDELGGQPNRPRSTSVRLRTREGPWLNLEMLGTAFMTPEGERQTIVNAHDISERLQAEQRSRELEDVLHQRQRLDAIGTLAGGVAHDFNNLLTVIGGHATLLEMDAGDRSATLESASAIRRAQESGASLTRQLLAFARRQVVAPTVLDLNELVSELERLLRRLVRAHVLLELDLRADPAFVEADRGQLEQVLMNLVVNANDALPEGGRILIRTSNVAVPDDDEGGEVPAGRWVVLHVADTGTGIDQAAMPHIFEPFYTTKERGQGTGLGLSTVYGIVTQTRGHITVDSERGYGATFHIFLPTASQRPQASHVGGGALREEIVDGGTILVAEDDSEIRKLVTRVLSRHGYTVLQSADGLEALKLLQRLARPPDLLLTDLVMPGVSGGELARRARQTWPGLPVVYMSGYADPADSGARSGHVQHIMLKPFSPAALLSRIRAEMAAVRREEADTLVAGDAD